MSGPNLYNNPSAILQNRTEINHNMDTLMANLKRCQIALELSSPDGRDPRVVFRDKSDTGYHRMARLDEVEAEAVARVAGDNQLNSAINSAINIAAEDWRQALETEKTIRSQVDSRLAEDVTDALESVTKLSHWLDGKEDRLEAGLGITITRNALGGEHTTTISVTGGGGPSIAGDYLPLVGGTICNASDAINSGKKTTILPHDSTNGFSGPVINMVDEECYSVSVCGGNFAIHKSANGTAGKFFTAANNVISIGGIAGSDYNAVCIGKGGGAVNLFGAVSINGIEMEIESSTGYLKRKST